jgi:hypothetical protein
VLISLRASGQLWVVTAIEEGEVAVRRSFAFLKEAVQFFDKLVRMAFDYMWFVEARWSPRAAKH